jgi:hypothetical protein
MENIEPILERPVNETEDPNLAKLRKENELPRCKKSNTDVP